MMRYELEDAAVRAGLKVKNMYLAGKMAWLVGNIAAIDPSVKDVPYRYNRCLLHEMAHYYTCPFDLTRAPASTRRKYEYLADRTVAENLMPVERIIDFSLQGHECLDEWADEFQLDEAYITHIFMLYQHVYGYNYHCGDYIVRSFVPLNIAKVDDLA